MVVENKKEQPGDEAILLVHAMMLSSDATYEDGKGTCDPTDIALLIFGDIDPGLVRSMRDQNLKDY